MEEDFLVGILIVGIILQKILLCMVREIIRLRRHLTRLDLVLVASLNLPSGVKTQQITPQMWSFKQIAFLSPSSLSAMWAEKRIYQSCQLAEVYFLVEQQLIRTIVWTGKISHTCRKKIITAPQSPSVSIWCHGNTSAVEEGGMNFLLANYAGWPTSTIWKTSETQYLFQGTVSFEIFVSFLYFFLSQYLIPQLGWRRVMQRYHLHLISLGLELWESWYSL